MRRAARILGTTLVLAGVGMLAWAGVTWAWQDPFTTVYTRLEQRELASRYAEQATRFRIDSLDAPARPQEASEHETAEPAAADAAQPRALTASRRARLAAVAARYRAALGVGQAVGRMTVPRLDLSMVVVEGTDPATLKKGPGRYRGSRLPGEGHLIYVAGHRTTYSAPFARIDRLRPGDRVVFELPYATVEYRITRHVIVRADEVSVLRSRGREELALQACHPRFFASHRYIAYAVPARVTVGDASYVVPRST